MIKVKDMIEDVSIKDMKKDSLLALSQEKTIQDFLARHHLDTQMMQDYWVELLDYYDDYMTCLHCSSLESCPKVNKGMRKILDYYDGDIVLELESCPYGLSFVKQRALLDHFVVTNVNQELLLTDIQSLSLLKKEQLTPNEIRAFALISKYIKDPTETGFFLHGDMGVGKTTLLAGLMNALAKKGKDIGFIHFPTYLVDLKASFSSGDNHYLLEKLLKVDYLLLDEIGEENVTAYSRDEVLLTILSYRLLNHLPTFFTSMYGYKDLKKVYTLKKGDEMRANTIISKMKALSIEIMLDGDKMKY